MNSNTRSRTALRTTEQIKKQQLRTSQDACGVAVWHRKLSMGVETKQTRDIGAIR